MSVITALAPPLANEPQGQARDELVLTSEQRANPHLAVQTVGGRTLRISLPRGTELHDGDVVLRENGLTIVIRAADEALLWLTPQDSVTDWNAACYQLGNLHRPVRFLDGGVLTPSDPLALQVLRGLDVSLQEVTRPFVGRRFGAAGAHHHRGDGDRHHHHS